MGRGKVHGRVTVEREPRHVECHAPVENIVPRKIAVVPQTAMA